MVSSGQQSQHPQAQRKGKDNTTQQNKLNKTNETYFVVGWEQHQPLLLCKGNEVCRHNMVLHLLLLLLLLLLLCLCKQRP